jgi:hypothetical protein
MFGEECKLRSASFYTNFAASYSQASSIYVLPSASETDFHFLTLKEHSGTVVA